MVAVLWLLLALFVLYPLVELIGRALSDDSGFTLAPLTARHQQQEQSARIRQQPLARDPGRGVRHVFRIPVRLHGGTDAGAGFWVRLLDVATLLPLISPPFTTSIAFVFSFGPRGFITHDLLGMNNATVYGLTSTLAAETLTYFPLAYMALRPMLAGIGGDLEEMAFSLGSSRWRVFRTVTLSLTVPGLANAFLLLFAASLADFATPLILAGNEFPVLPTEAYLQITGMFDLKGGAVLSLLLLVPAGIVYVLQRNVVGAPPLRDMTGKGRAGHRETASRPGPALR